MNSLKELFVEHSTGECKKPEIYMWPLLLLGGRYFMISSPMQDINKALRFGVFVWNRLII